MEKCINDEPENLSNNSPPKAAVGSPFKFGYPVFLVCTDCTANTELEADPDINQRESEFLGMVVEQVHVTMLQLGQRATRAASRHKAPRASGLGQP